jgi:hypothetical protein
MKGSEPVRRPKSDKDSDESMDEADFAEVEKKLSPIERERLVIKQQRESLPMHDYRD